MITGPRAWCLLGVKVEQTETLPRTCSAVIFADQDVCGAMDLMFGDLNSLR